jgi:serine/threonine-protein kinase
MWEALTARRLYEGLEVAALVKRILNDDPVAPTKVKPDLPPALDAVVLKALARSRDDRYPTALAFAQAIEKVIPPIPMREVADWVSRVGDETLRSRADLVSKTEKVSLPPPADPRESYPDTVGGLLSQRGSRPELDRAPPETSGTTTIVDPIRHAQEQQPPASKRFTLFFVAGGVVLSIVFLVIALRAFSKPKVEPAPIPPVSVASSVTEAPPPAASSSSPPVVVTIEDEPTPSAKPSASASPRVRTAAPRRNCDPPWTVDARGVRVLKRECL